MRWSNRTLGEIFAFQNGRAFKTSEWSDEGLPIIRIANLSRMDAPFNHFSGEFEDKIFIQNGDLIFSWSGSLKVEIWERGDALLNQHLFKVESRIKLNPKWRYYLLLKCIDVLSSKMTGATLQHVTKKELEATTIKLPPMEEQVRIVEILDQAFEAIDKAKTNIERNLANARELFQSRLNEIFSNPPSDWEVKPLGEVCDFVRGPFGSSLKKNCFVKSGFAVYEQRHPIHGNFNSFRYFINPDKFEEMRRFEVQPGNVLMSCSGTIGKTEVVPPNAPKGIINQALLNLKPRGELVPMYLKKWMDSISFISQIEERIAGAALKNIASVKVLKTIAVPIPTIERQGEICVQLEGISKMLDDASASYQAQLNNLEELRQSILEQAFEGKLTEPATA